MNKGLIKEAKPEPEMIPCGVTMRLLVIQK